MTSKSDLLWQEVERLGRILYDTPRVRHGKACSAVREADVSIFRDTLLAHKEAIDVTGQPALFGDVTIRDLEGRLNSCHTEYCPEAPGRIEFVKCQEIDRAAARRFGMRQIGERNFAITTAYYGEGRLTAPMTTCWGHVMGQWIMGRKRHECRPDMPGLVATHILHGIDRQLVQRYQWEVSLGLEGGASFAFQTDPVGAREVFRLRDLPNGANRRAALLHWVAEHWRKRRKDPTEEAKVRAHLRGATAFVWNGLTCRVRPAEFDVEQATRPRRGAGNVEPGRERV